jgi:uncharacterized membrane protein
MSITVQSFSVTIPGQSALAPVNKPAATPERTLLFSDAVFAIVITILVLDLRPPESASVTALLSLWPRALSYAVSYLFLAIVWMNHHYLLRHARLASPRLLWSNFAHLFAVSLVPFATAWIAGTSLAGTPVALYAMIFVLVNATYLMLCWEVIDRPSGEQLSPRVRRMLHMRSVGTLAVFIAAAIIALAFPLAGMFLICACLVLYLRPEAPGKAV